MLAYSIGHALSSRYINKTIVSTDSKEYSQLSLSYGAEVPFLRPAEYAQDLSLDIDVFNHALYWLKENESYTPDICVHLRPTCPIRNVTDIDAMIEILISNPELDSVRSIALVKETPYKMWRMESNGLLSPLLGDIPEAYNNPRQSLPTVYIQNAAIDVIRTKTILEKHSMTGDKIYGYVMDENLDIDYLDELEKAHFGLQLEAKKHTFCFDIDGVIASLVEDNDYSKSKPIRENIFIINKLYAMGHHIVLFTARGYTTKIDWRSLTKQQLSSWEVKYHELLFDKPAASYYIDDRFISINKLKRYIG